MANFVMIGTFVLLGTLFRRLKAFPAETAQVLNMFALYVSLPAVILLKVPTLTLTSQNAIAAVVPWCMLLLSAVVIQLLAKFLGGHADALGGIVCGKKELIEAVYHYREINGATLDPMAAYLLLRGMKTLPLRIECQNQNAIQIARFLQSHAAVEQIFYPGLDSHPQHDIARRQMKGFGGMLSFSVKGGYRAVAQFLPRLRFAHRAANLGAVETIVGPPATTSHVELSAQERAAMGIPENLVRYSVGIEDATDLIQDLKQALDSLGSERSA